MRNVIDMTYKRLALTILLGLALLPLATAAQERTTTRIISIGKRGWLGISYDFTATSRDGKTTETLTVMDVIKDSPADRVGVKKGDQILRIDGKAVSEDAFNDLIKRLEPGSTVQLRVASGDRERDVTLVATDRPTNEAMFFLRGDSINRALRIYLDSARAGMIRMDSIFGDSMFRGRVFMPRFFMPDIRVFRGPVMDSIFLHGWSRDSTFFKHGDAFQIFVDSLPRSWGRAELPWRDMEMEFPRFEMLTERGVGGVAGAEFTPINEGLSSYFGTDRGLLVVRVGPQTPAARAGLVSGDVITRVNGQIVDEVNDFRQAVSRAGNETLKVEILRKGKTRTLEFQPRTRRQP
jgi:predicted metalloprotease with PDZ domain